MQFKPKFNMQTPNFQTLAAIFKCQMHGSHGIRNLGKVQELQRRQSLPGGFRPVIVSPKD